MNILHGAKWWSLKLHLYKLAQRSSLVLTVSTAVSVCIILYTVTVTCVIVSVVAVSCVEGWCCVLGWCPFYSLGVVAVLCSPNTMCIDPGVWSLLSWLGFTTTAIVPTIWLTADSWLRAQARRILPGVCAGEESHIKVALGNSSAGSTVSTEFTTVDRVPGRNALK